MASGYDARDPWTSIHRSSGAKKFASATAVADHGDTQALYVKPSFGTGVSVGIECAKFTLYNNSGSEADVGLAVRFGTSAWGAGQVTAAGVFTDDTTDAQDVGAGDFPLHDPADSGSGFIVHADAPFNVIGIVQSAAGDQTTPALVVEVWTGAWTALTTDAYVADTLIGGGTGEKLLWVPVHPQWIKGGSGVGVRQDRYNMRVRHTNTGAGAETPAASQLFVGFGYYGLEALSDRSYHGDTFPEGAIRFPTQGEALHALFSVADLKNTINALARPYLL